jgi:predicted transcriptional regulator
MGEGSNGPRGPYKIYRLSDDEKHVLKIAIENPGISVANICEKLKADFESTISESHCYKIIETLWKNNFLRREQLTRSYRITATPKAKRRMKAKMGAV